MLNRGGHFAILTSFGSPPPERFFFSLVECIAPLLLIHFFAKRSHGVTHTHDKGVKQKAPPSKIINLIVSCIRSIFKRFTFDNCKS